MIVVKETETYVDGWYRIGPRVVWSVFEVRVITCADYATVVLPR